MDDLSLSRYADLVIRVGLNLQAGQRLLILGPLANGGVALDAAPLVRAVSARAYEAGAPLVEVLWGDESLAMLALPPRAARVVRPVFRLAPRRARRTRRGRARDAVDLRERSRPAAVRAARACGGHPVGHRARREAVPRQDFAGMRPTGRSSPLRPRAGRRACSRACPGRAGGAALGRRLRVSAGWTPRIRLRRGSPTSMH